MQNYERKLKELMQVEFELMALVNYLLTAAYDEPKYQQALEQAIELRYRYKDIEQQLQGE